MITMPRDQAVNLIKFAQRNWERIVSVYVRALYDATRMKDHTVLDELLAAPLVKSLTVGLGNGYNPLGNAIDTYIDLANSSRNEEVIRKLLRTFVVSDGYMISRFITPQKSLHLVERVIDIFHENHIDMDDPRSRLLQAVIRLENYQFLGKMLYGGFGLKVTPWTVKAACSIWREAHHKRNARRRKEFATSAIFKLIELGADVAEDDVGTVRVILGSSFKMNVATREMLQASIVKAELLPKERE